MITKSIDNDLTNDTTNTNIFRHVYKEVNFNNFGTFISLNCNSWLLTLLYEQFLILVLF